MTEYDVGYNSALEAVIAMLQDYSFEVIKDKKYQASNYLNAATNKIDRMKIKTK